MKICQYDYAQMLKAYIDLWQYSLFGCSFNSYICMQMSKVQYLSYLKFSSSTADQDHLCAMS